jgi:two-component system OmpR family response regulator
LTSNLVDADRRPRVIIGARGGIDDFSLCAAIEQAGMSATVANSTLQVRRLLYRRCYHLLIVDAVVAPEEAIRLCDQLRDREMVPILLIVPPDLIVSAFDAGADDCMSLPLSLPELLARIKNLLRCAFHSTIRPRVFELTFAQFRLNLPERALWTANGEMVRLTAAEFDLLLTFCRNPGRLLSRDELLASTHTGLAGPVTRSIDVHISRLRRKIEKDPQRPCLVKTVRLGGYMLAAEVTAR